LHSLQLNGQPLGTISPNAPKFDIALLGLFDRNQLDLVVDAAVAKARSAGADWGTIALVIRATALGH
jgi:hypothetical protein